MIKKTLLGLILTSSLILAGCAANVETENPDGTINSDDSTASAPAFKDNASLEGVFALSVKEILELGTDKIDEEALAEINALTAASIEESKKGYSEASYSLTGGTSYTLYYKSPKAEKNGVFAVINEAGEAVKGLTAFIEDDSQFSLYNLLFDLEADSIVGAAKDVEGNLILSVSYEQESSPKPIKIVYFLTSSEGLITGLVSANDFSAETFQQKTIMVYGENPEYEKLFAIAVPQAEIDIDKVNTEAEAEVTKSQAEAEAEQAKSDAATQEEIDKAQENSGAVN